MKINYQYICEDEIVLTSIVHSDEPALRRHRRMSIQMPPRLSGSQIDHNDTGPLERAVRDVGISVATEVEPDVVQRRVSCDDRRREGERRNSGTVQIEPNKLWSPRRRRQKHRAIDAGPPSVQRPNPVLAIHDDGLDEEELVGRDTEPWIRLVRERGRGVRILTKRQYLSTPWTTPTTTHVQQIRRETLTPGMVFQWSDCRLRLT